MRLELPSHASVDNSSRKTKLISIFIDYLVLRLKFKLLIITIRVIKKKNKKKNYGTK